MNLQLINSTLPVVDVPPLCEWDKLFKDAKKIGFDPVKDAKEFADWDITLHDGIR